MVDLGSGARLGFKEFQIDDSFIAERRSGPIKPFEGKIPFEGFWQKNDAA
jgi:hypothetical protein